MFRDALKMCSSGEEEAGGFEVQFGAPFQHSALRYGIVMAPRKRENSWDL